MITLEWTHKPPWPQNCKHLILELQGASQENLDYKVISEGSSAKRQKEWDPILMTLLKILDQDKHITLRLDIPYFV